MADIWGTIDRVEGMLRAGSASSGRRAGSGGSGPRIGKPSFRPNAPRMVTVLASIALILLGLTVSGTVSIGFVSDLLARTDLQLTQEQGFWMLFASPVLLILGSLLPGL